MVQPRHHYTLERSTYVHLYLPHSICYYFSSTYPPITDVSAQTCPSANSNPIFMQKPEFSSSLSSICFYAMSLFVLNHLVMQRKGWIRSVMEMCLYWKQTWILHDQIRPNAETTEAIDSRAFLQKRHIFAMVKTIASIISIVPALPYKIILITCHAPREP